MGWKWRGWRWKTDLCDAFGRHFGGLVDLFLGELKRWVLGSSDALERFWTRLLLAGWRGRCLFVCQDSFFVS